MGQIPLSFPSVISPLAAADLFQIYSSRTEMRFWSNELNPVYVCGAVTSTGCPKVCYIPGHRNLESNADLPVRLCVIHARNKRTGSAALGMQGAKRGLHGVVWLEGATCWAPERLPALGCSRCGASAGPAAPPCGQPGKWGCSRHRGGWMDGWITSLLAAGGGSGKTRIGRQQRQPDGQIGSPLLLYDHLRLV